MKKIAKRELDRITAAIAAEYPSFGRNGRGNDGNPIAAATADRDPMFALGVDIRSVVERVLKLAQSPAQTVRRR